MRLQKYMKLSCDNENINRFRMLNINLCEKSNNEYSEIVREIEKSFDIKKSILEEIENYNKEVKRFYGKNYEFQLVEDKIKLLNINMKDKIKRIHFKLNDMLSEIKFEIEKKY